MYTMSRAPGAARSFFPRTDRTLDVTIEPPVRTAATAADPTLMRTRASATTFRTFVQPATPSAVARATRTAAPTARATANPTVSACEVVVAPRAFVTGPNAKNRTTRAVATRAPRRAFPRKASVARIVTPAVTASTRRIGPTTS